MSEFAIYDIATRRVRMVFTGSRAMAIFNAREGESVGEVTQAAAISPPMIFRDGLLLPEPPPEG